MSKTLNTKKVKFDFNTKANVDLSPKYDNDITINRKVCYLLEGITKEQCDLFLETNKGIFANMNISHYFYYNPEDPNKIDLYFETTGAKRTELVINKTALDNFVESPYAGYTKVYAKSNPKNFMLKEIHNKSESNKRYSNPFVYITFVKETEDEEAFYYIRSYLKPNAHKHAVSVIFNKCVVLNVTKTTVSYKTPKEYQETNYEDETFDDNDFEEDAEKVEEVQKGLDNFETDETIQDNKHAFKNVNEVTNPKNISYSEIVVKPTPIAIQQQPIAIQQPKAIQQQPKAIQQPIMKQPQVNVPDEFKFVDESVTYTVKYECPNLPLNVTYKIKDGIITITGSQANIAVAKSYFEQLNSKMKPLEDDDNTVYNPSDEEDEDEQCN